MAIAPQLLAPARVRRLAVREGLSSSAAVARTHRLDGRTTVVAVRDAFGWRRVRRLAWTPNVISALREERVHEVVIRRGFRRGRLPLAWLPRHEGA